MTGVQWFRRFIEKSGKAEDQAFTSRRALIDRFSATDCFCIWQAAGKAALSALGLRKFSVNKFDDRALFLLLRSQCAVKPQAQKERGQQNC